MGGKAGCVVITHTLVGRQMWWWEFAETIHCLSSQCCKMQDHHLRVRLGKKILQEVEETKIRGMDYATVAALQAHFSS